MKNKLHNTSVLHLLLFEEVVSVATFIRHEISIFPKFIDYVLGFIKLISMLFKERYRIHKRYHDNPNYAHVF